MVVRIRTFLIFGFGGLLFTALAVTLFLGFYSATQNTFSLLTDKANALIESTIWQVEQELKPVERQAKWIVTSLRNKVISFDDPEKLETFLLGSLGTTPNVATIFLATTDDKGYRVRQSTRRMDVANISNVAAAVSAVARARNLSGPSWEEPIWLEEISDAAINLRTPLVVDDEYLGVLVQINSISELSKSLSRNTSYLGSHVPFILYDDDYVLAHSLLTTKAMGGSKEAPLPTTQQFDDKVIANLKNLNVFENSKRYSIGDAVRGQLEVDGENYFVLYKNIEGYADKPITVGAYFIMSSIDAEINLLYGSMIIAVLVMILTLILAVWLSRRISEPVHDIQQAVWAINTEDYKDVPEIQRGFLMEFNETADAFDNMVKGLKEKEIILDLFGRVVPSAVAEEMLKNPDGLKPYKTTATVLFSDLAHFTSISEKLQPEGIVELLNGYFSVMTEIIRHHGGIVTQFQGDAVLAVFNVPLEDPNHALNAVKAAREMANAMKNMVILGHPLKCRIGVNTGLLVAGNVGAAKRMNYTVHGDAVNLAARLEQLNKEYGTTVLVSGSTVEISGLEGMKSLGSVTVRGKSQSVDIYTFIEE